MIRLRDVLKNCWRGLEEVSTRRLQDVFKTSWKRLQNVFKTSRKLCLIFQINAFELVAVNFPFNYENTCSWQSMWLKAVLKSQIWLKLTFSHLKYWESNIKVIFFRFQLLLEIVNTFAAKGFSKKRAFCAFK